MGIYSVQENPRVDEKIQRDLDIIVTEVLASTNPVSIILTGSFGRGEGSVLLHDDQIIKIKDYDIILVADRNSLLTVEKLKELKDRVTKRCGFSELENQYALTSHHLEFYQFTLHEFLGEGHLKMSYDVKYASRLLYGKDIRGQIEPDLKKLALSHCYYSLMKSIQNLLKQFSVEYFTFPPEGIERFSMIFFLSNVYLHMGTQLSLCHDFYHPTCKVRGERLKDHYACFCPDLATKVPYLPDKINYFAELKLFPNSIANASIDPVDLWFDALQDFDLVMKYCLNTVAHLDSNEWTVLCERLYRSLKTYYYYYFFEYSLERRYNVKSPLIPSLKNIQYQLHHTRRYMNTLQKEHRFPLKMYLASPIFKILAISPLLLFSFQRDGSVDKTLFAAFWREFSEIYPYGGADMQVPTASNWESVKNILRKNMHID